MKKFKLYENVLKCYWDGYYYEIEAETEKEALEKLLEGESRCLRCGIFWQRNLFDSTTTTYEVCNEKHEIIYHE